MEGGVPSFVFKIVQWNNFNFGILRANCNDKGLTLRDAFEVNCQLLFFDGAFKLVEFNKI